MQLKFYLNANISLKIELELKAEEIKIGREKGLLLLTLP